MSPEKELYSVVIPVFNSEKGIDEVVSRVINFFQNNNLNFEIILVNDCSKDNSWVKIKEIAQKEENITSINLLKNYGQHNALFCGFKIAKGDFVITLDDDLQYLPEEIKHLIDKIHEGYDAVFGKYKKTQYHQNIIRCVLSKLMHIIIPKMFNVPADITISSFRIIRRNVVDGIINYKTNFPYITGLIFLFSGTVANVDVKHNKREFGKSNYSFIKSLRLISKILINYSSYPLIITSSFGLFLSMSSFLFGIFILIKHFTSSTTVPGWASLAILISVLNGYLIFMMGILSEYCFRMLVELSSNQGYQIREIIKKKSVPLVNQDLYL